MTKKNQGRIPATAIVDSPKKRFNQGVNNSIVFVAVLEATLMKLNQRREATLERRLELVHAAGGVRHVLQQYFLISPKSISDFIASIPTKLIEDQSEFLFKKMTTKIIIPGQPAAGYQGIYVASARVDIDKIKRDIAAANKGPEKGNIQIIR